MSKKLVIGFLIVFLVASIIMLCTSMLVSMLSGYGAEFALACFRLADGWVFGVLLVSAFSLMDRIRERNCTASYIVGLVFVVLAILSFFVAVTAGNARSVLAGFICFILFAVCGLAIPAIINHIKRKGDNNADGDKANKKELQQSDFEAQWTRVRAKLARISDNEKKIRLLENTLLYFPKELDINNGLDFANPVLAVDDNLYTVAAAEKDGSIPKLEIETSKALIANLFKEEK